MQPYLLSFAQNMIATITRAQRISGLLTCGLTLHGHLVDGGQIAQKQNGFQIGGITDLMNEHAKGNKRIAVDKVMIAGFRALEAAGFEVMNGEELTEKTRVIKGEDEILAMRCAMNACEASVRAMEEAAKPGMTEDEIWAVLHAENIKRGGEWIETRLMASRSAAS